MDTTIISVKNPLRYKTQFQTAEESAMRTFKERDAWMDAQFKRMLPPAIYAKARSNTPADRQAAQTWLDDHNYAIAQEELTTAIIQNGKIIAKFVINLTEQ